MTLLKLIIWRWDEDGIRYEANIFSIREGSSKDRTELHKDIAEDRSFLQFAIVVISAHFPKSDTFSVMYFFSMFMCFLLECLSSVHFWRDRTRE